MTSPAVTSAPFAAPSGLRLWGQGTVLASLAITAIDALLLQQKKAFFTGGFLTETYARTPADAIAFVCTSLVVDAGVAGLLAALLLLLTSRLRLTAHARRFLVAAGALAPLLVWDFVTYSLLTHLGDAFDLGLMFDLTGRSTAEIFAVSASHLAVPAALITTATAGLSAVVWTINRLAAAPRVRAGALGRTMRAAAALVAIGLVTFAATSSTSDLLEDGLRRKASGQLFTNLVAAGTDFDRDGYGIGGRTGDPAPFDAAVFPYAPDVPGNGIDENAIGGDLSADAPGYAEPAPVRSPWRQRPDVVLFVLESFRADVVGRRVNGRPVTPVMETLAAEGVSASRAFSHNGYTTQSRFHLLTGSLAGLREGSLVDDFKAQGYETAYFSAQDESFGGPAFGVGFDRADVSYDARQDRARRYTTFTTAGSLAVSQAVVQERLEAFLRTRDSSRPLFLYVNFHDTHFPYHHRGIEPVISSRTVGQREIAPGNADAVREMYDNTAANVDRAVGTTLALVARSTGREPAVIVTADHGESLFDEGFLGHGYALNDAQTRIPLIARGLALEIVEPFGQVELRDAVTAALSIDSGGAPAKPRIREDPLKRVFQYLGTIHRPRQIGFATGGDRVAYDFRDERFVSGDGTSRQPGALRKADGSGFVELISFWERLIVARAGALADRDR